MLLYYFWMIKILGSEQFVSFKFSTKLYLEKNIVKDIEQPPKCLALHM